MEPCSLFLLVKLLGSSRIDHTSKVSLAAISGISCLAFSYVPRWPSQVGSTFLIEFEDVFKEHRIFFMQFRSVAVARTRRHLNNGTYSNSMRHDVTKLVASKEYIYVCFPLYTDTLLCTN